LGPGGSIVRGGKVIAAEVEEVVDLIVGGEETLGLSGRLEAFHLPLKVELRSSPRKSCGILMWCGHTDERKTQT
jgi:hypothetical protein